VVSGTFSSSFGFILDGPEVVFVYDGEDKGNEGCVVGISVKGADNLVGIGDVAAEAIPAAF
jgi:hypothetical protein